MYCIINFTVEGQDILVVLDRLILRATTKKESSTFLTRKVHPRQNPGYTYDFRLVAVGPSMWLESEWLKEVKRQNMKAF